MQYIRQLTCRNKLTLLQIRQVSKSTKIEALKSSKIPRFSPQNQEILDDYMIPGPALKYFKTKRERRKADVNNSILDVNENLYTSPARPLSFSEFDSAPTIAQERLAERIKRAISTMYSSEALPTQWITLGQLTIREVKVSRNLKKCQVMYEPLSNNKKERGNVHRALTDYSYLLNTLIRKHAQMKRPLSIKFVADTQSRELEAIFAKISAEEEER